MPAACIVLTWLGSARWPMPVSRQAIAKLSLLRWSRSQPGRESLGFGSGLFERSHAGQPGSGE